MGYLSCTAESAVLTSNSNTSTSSTDAAHKPKKKNHRGEEPLKIQQFEYSDLEAATNGFSAQKLLGRGSHGCVYKGVLRSGRLVAVKKSSRGRGVVSRAAASSADNNSNEVDNEIDILSRVRGPRLVNLLGFTNDSRDRLLVVEFMSNGTLYEVLHNSSRPPNWGRRIKLALQAAEAIDTLHSCFPPIIHRDIKSANVLIDRNFNARLGDFGLALRCHVDNFRLRSTPPAGTIGYLDPGYLTPDNLSTKTDVFSFGILLLEIISGRKAIDVGHSPPSIVDWAIPLIRKGKLLSIYDPRIAPPKDPMVRKQLAVIAGKCVRSCRERRPSMKDIVECLGVLNKMVPLHSWNNLSVGNPCLMVETVGRPVESENAHLNTKPKGRVVENGDMMDSRNSRPLRNSRRVYSDLGLVFRSNLMDLMAGTDEDSSFRREADGVEHSSPSVIGGFLGPRRVRSIGPNYDRDGVSQLSRNQSVGGRLKQSFSCVDGRVVSAQATKPV
ncbi:serine/threonine-protein kinase-like protein At3g51990 [Macadamia integrifolia]|uniref:serine/threonine-protein kinase-like protein At3g51990 n=1 Tax=Macadamia integrifolia TaxID=60698 RepID=UPI001C4FDCEB|nr:serine/threonine-protein kinase-like protein At3g51990 [Macadamia integrifolia]